MSSNVGDLTHEYLFLSEEQPWQIPKAWKGSGFQKHSLGLSACGDTDLEMQKELNNVDYHSFLKIKCSPVFTPFL